MPVRVDRAWFDHGREEDAPAYAAAVNAGRRNTCQSGQIACVAEPVDVITIQRAVGGEIDSFRCWSEGYGAGLLIAGEDSLDVAEV